MVYFLQENPCPKRAYIHKKSIDKEIFIMSEFEKDIVEMEGEDGAVLKLCVERYFYYNGEEYVLLSDDVEENNVEEVSHYVMKVVPDEEEEGMEDFVPVDDDLMDKLVDAAMAVFEDEDEDEE